MFESSKLIFKKDQIGKIKTNTNCIQRINNINVANRIREGRYKLIYLNVEPFDLCVLPNGNILCADFREHNISVYDKHLKLIKKVELYSIPSQYCGLFSERWIHFRQHRRWLLLIICVLIGRCSNDRW